MESERNLRTTLRFIFIKILSLLVICEGSSAINLKQYFTDLL